MQKIHERIEAVYEDIDLVIIEKASGVLSYPVANQHGAAAIQLIRKYWQARNMPDRNLYLIHRLDQDTSGLMVFAKTTLARESLAKQFEEHTVVRGYLAVTAGIPRKSFGTIKTLLAHDDRGKRSVARRGKLAVTRYEVVRTDRQSNRALVRCMLKTGRTHQARIHLAHIHAPVLGDSIYGVRSQSRLALHASILGFVHPRTRGPLLLYSPLPGDLRSLIR